MTPLAPVYSLLWSTSSQVRTFPLLMTGMSTPSTRAFTTERSAAPCRRRRAEGWRACKARKAAPDAWRLLASVSVEDTGLQRRNLAETGTHNECERDETMPWTRGQSLFPSKYAPKCSSLATSCGHPRFRSASQCHHRDPRLSLRHERSRLDRSRRLGLSRVP